jgi:hypothetical protein
MTLKNRQTTDPKNRLCCFFSVDLSKLDDPVGGNDPHSPLFSAEVSILWLADRL